MSQPPEYPSYPGPEQPSTPPPGYNPPPTPPPPGYNPPPPPGQAPPGYGQAPPGYGQAPPPAYYGPAPGQPSPYAGWWSRVGASLLDGLISLAISLIPLVAGLVLAFKDLTYDESTDTYSGDVNPGGIALLALALLLAVAFGFWNVVLRQGRTGQTLGKKIVGIKVVKEDGQMLGTGGAFLRWFLMAVFGNACFLDYLWPLWDAKSQTWHDMVVGSVVVPA